MSALSIPDLKIISGKNRYFPLFFWPFILVMGYVLASMSYSLIMERAGWKSGNPDKANLSAVVGAASSDIYLLNSKRTRDYFASVGGNYDLILNQWRYFFQVRGISYVDILDDDLKPGLKPGVLILPSAVALSAQQSAAIRAFEIAGGSALVTWASGARGGNGEWIGYGFLQDQFNVKVTGEIAMQDKENFLMAFGDTPVAHSLPAGSRIWLGKSNERPLRVTGGSNVAGRFTDAVRTPGTANEAIVYTEVAASRRVYLGFPETSWRFQQTDVYTLLGDVLKWLQHKPDAYLADWPHPYRAAQVVEMDTEQGFPNAVKFADLLDVNGLRGTFYSLTSVAAQYPEVVRQLERKHEIAYHGDVHDAFKGQSGEVQSKRLDVMRQQMRALVSNPSKLTGFRPPYELSDQVVESVLFEKGYRHILANSDGTQAMLPYLSAVSPKDFRNGLVVLPRTQKDDMNFIREGISSADMTKTMNEGFDQTLEAAALGVLSVHSQNFDAGSAVEKSTAEFLAHLKSSGNKAWIAPAGEIESWWRERALIQFKLSGEAQRMLLEVTIEKPGLTRNAAIVISNSVRGSPPEIKTAKIGMNLPLLVPLDEFRTAIVFNDLSPGDYSYYLSY
jgi:hypothetical protein